MASNSTVCATCKKDKPTYSCSGCSKRFCFQHVEEHRHALKQQLAGIIKDCAQSKQKIIEQRQSSLLLAQINEWEQTSSETIRRTAQVCRETVSEHIRRGINSVENNFGPLDAKLESIRKADEFNETDLRRLTNDLTKLKQELNKPPNMVIEHDSRPLINRFYTTVLNANQPEEGFYCQWLKSATTVAGGHGEGRKLKQLKNPWGIWVTRDKSILIADSDNDRIVRWDGQAKEGTVIAGGNGRGGGRDQLNDPADVLVDRRDHSIIIADQGNRRVVRWFGHSRRKPEILIDNIECGGLAMDKDGFLYVSDEEKHEVRRWKEGETQTTLVAGGNERGHQLDQLHEPSYLFVDDQQSVYVSDRKNHRVMKWVKGARKGVIVAGGNGYGEGLNQLHAPRGVLVDRWGHIHVADTKNHRVMRWCEGERDGTVVAGGQSPGQGSEQLDSPNGLSFDEADNLYVADLGNDRIQKFDFVSVKDVVLS